MKNNLKKVLLYSVLSLLSVGVFGFSNPVSAATQEQTAVNSQVKANYYKPLRIWITLGSSYDYGATHYFEYNGYRGYLSRVTREKVGTSATTLYRGYLYSRDVKSIPAPASLKKKLQF